MPPASLKRVTSTDRDISPPPPAKRRVAVTTTSSAVSNFFKPTSQKEPEKISFQIVHETLLVARYKDAHTFGRPKPLKVAAFDFDDTVITSKSGQKIARGADDWRWWNAVVPGRLKELAADGYAIVIVSNQAGVSLRSDPKSPKDGMKSLNNIKGKLTGVMNALDLPITAYAATGLDIYRKPRCGMWEQILKDYGMSEPGDIDLEHSVFVGDAAGREGDKAAGIKKDHSCSDRDFAHNNGILFHTPEEYFLGEVAKPFKRTFDPATYVEVEVPSITDSTPIVFVKKDALDIVLFCGSPGAGKSTFYWRCMQPLGYERVNQDILKSRDKCMAVAAQYLDDRISVVVDNTNADTETRAAWISFARRRNIPIRLVHFTASVKLAEHNDIVRALTGDLMNPERRTMLPKAAFSGFTARYREPNVEEGFEDITEAVFKFDGSEDQKAAWRKFWIS